MDIDDTAAEIMMYMSVPELLNKCSISKTIARVCNDPEFWRTYLKRHTGISYPYSDIKQFVVSIVAILYIPETTTTAKRSRRYCTRLDRHPRFRVDGMKVYQSFFILPSERYAPYHFSRYYYIGDSNQVPLTGLYTKIADAKAIGMSGKLYEVVYKTVPPLA